MSAHERKLAIRRITRAHAHGRLTDAAAGRRRALLEGARTRQEVRAALDGLSGACPRWNLAALTGIAAVFWLVVTIAEIIVWLTVCLIGGGWDEPWWAWSMIVRGAMTVGLWQIGEWEHRARLTEDSSPIEPDASSSENPGAAP